MKLRHAAKLLIVVVIVGLWFFVPSEAPTGKSAPPTERWLQPQNWTKHTAGPVVALGEAGAFDDRHVFAPSVFFDANRFFLLYPGSRGEVAERVFRLGLATGDDGVHLDKSASNPVFEFGDGRRSVVTPAILRDTSGRPLRENGKLRMWFTAVDFHDGLHTLHETSGVDASQWSPPSEAQLEHAYAPTIIREAGLYHLWYTDVGREPWSFRHAVSRDGKTWDVTPKPVLTVDQDWEHRRLFYPTVVKAAGLYLMWYASYWTEQPGADTTAVGFAVSTDGVRWRKSPHNPVLRPDPSLPWESHYNSSQSVIRLPDGTWRMWYASRKAPPYVNKYFAICTATWPGPS